MKIPAMIAAELRRLTRSPMALIALLALGIVPLLYGGFYLWANQDPYAKLNAIPVALVVSDTGYSSNGKHTNYGDEVATQLLADGTFNWHRVSAAAAAHGLNDQKFDFSVTLPADFSEAIVSSSTPRPQQATVILTTNDANSYLGTTIGEQAVKKIQAQIVAQVNEQAAGQFLVGLSTIRTSLVSATDGAQNLLDGATAAADGAAQLATGTASLAAGTVSLRDGLGAVATATSALPAQSAALADGASQVAAGNQQLAGIGDRVGTVSADVVNQLQPTRDQIEQQLESSAVLSPAQIDAVLATLDRLGAAVRSGNDHVQHAVGTIDALAEGSAQVASGAQRLADATPALVAGIQAATSGSSSLAEGAAQASAGAAQLSSGLPDLVTGLTTLHGALHSGYQSIPETTEAERTAQAKNIANPVAVQESAVARAGTYGAGLAPFFVALAAWIGIYALFLIVKPVSRRAITALHSPIKITFAGWLTPALIGALQMVGLYVIVAVVLGFKVENPLGTYGLMALSSITFAAMILALNIWLGSVGQFVGLVLMVVQLVTAGGTFPWQTLPAPLAFVHHLLPMSYSVDGLRQLMYGGNLAEAMSDVWVLIAWLACAVAIAALGVVRMTHFRTLRDLEPSLIG
ncbi:YhgE/Pip family protein [Glaciibacter psychrotolerans]|uniref:Putative membrane protein n=1 Tax=Glaciibacter psychrotolerans TaxID=670054 RepID=A0A7Z0J754_9MICO|nr:YhgE/Pip family protein [Leifsonia psychrotolerans]NYJ21262.1 putative membrane protein [Leifsonia psychrotolerans]